MVANSCGLATSYVGLAVTSVSQLRRSRVEVAGFAREGPI